MQNTVIICLAAAILLVLVTAVLRRGSDHDEVRNCALQNKQNISKAKARVSISDKAAGSPPHGRETD
ncbi:MAG: hypothetical protein PHD91_03280 [bacterium]|jgi:hypothetical protein|nr:hypothetical protein [bacterium]MDD3806298.1 hypothetical protein [bacterium]MDD4152727.1 hypothetical protein [bacterium]MDD4558970.1 hypothetical protein [bacterium]